MSAKSQNSLRQNMLASFGDIELILVTISDFSPRYFRAQKIEQKEKIHKNKPKITKKMPIGTFEK